MDFGWPNVEIGKKIANGQQLFLALLFTINSFMVNASLEGPKVKPYRLS